MSSNTTFESKKGAAIKFIGGNYVDFPGWLNKTKDATKEFVYVIVRKKEGSLPHEVATKVRHENYVLLTEINEPANYEEAIFQQHADIDALLNKLVRSIAECDSVLETDHSSKNLFRVIKERLEKAKTRQNNKGSKARWRRVRFSPARSGGN
jgi:hypothetical protein